MKIIDMHIHSYSSKDFGERESAKDHYGVKGATDAESHRLATMAAFRKFNIVKAEVSGNPESVENWASKDSNHVVIKGILMFNPNDYGMDSVKFEQMIRERRLRSLEKSPLTMVAPR